MDGLSHKELQEASAQAIPQTVLYESENPLKHYIHNQRRELIIQQVTNKGGTVLDVGCGDGFFLEKLRNGIGIDLSKTRIQRAKTRTKNPVLVCSAENLPFKDDAFDFVIISEVLEHLITPDLCLYEVSRLLKPEGKAVISIPNDNILELGGKMARILELFFGHFSKKMKYQRFAIHDHIRQLTPKHIETIFDIKQKHTVPFNFPFTLSFFHIGVYAQKPENTNTDCSENLKSTETTICAFLQNLSHNVDGFVDKILQFAQFFFVQCCQNNGCGTSRLG
jgi:2-polyprenyl-3-methyl-5-hydroxy-6-metoxy-1,4-benzoquinol methylase